MRKGRQVDDGYVEVGCDAHSRFSAGCSLWHLRFRRDDQGLPFDGEAIGPYAGKGYHVRPQAGRPQRVPGESWAEGEWTPDGFYAHLRMPARRFFCREHASEAGNAVFSYFDPSNGPGEMLPVKQLILYSRDYLVRQMVRKHCMREIHEYARRHQRKTDADADKQRDAAQSCAA